MVRFCEAPLPSIARKKTQAQQMENFPRLTKVGYDDVVQLSSDTSRLCFRDMLFLRCRQCCRT